MQRLVTSVNQREYEAIQEFCAENDLSLYAILKKALFLYIESESGRSPRSPRQQDRITTEKDRELRQLIDLFEEKGIDVGAVLKDTLRKELKSSELSPAKK